MWISWLCGALQRPALVLVCFGLLLLLSLWRLPQLNVDAFPDVTPVQVVINTQADGLAAEEVEQFISYPIETAMFGLPGVVDIRSLSRTGLSVVTVVFTEGSDAQLARQLVFQQLEQATEQIPSGFGRPEIGPDTSGLGEVFQYVLTASADSGVDAAELRSLNDYLVKLLLMPVDGVTEVLSFGGEVRQYQVQVDPYRLQSHQLTLEDVVAALRAANQNAGGWYQPQGMEQWVVRGYGLLPAGENGLQTLRELAIAWQGDTPIRLQQLARVQFGAEPRAGAVSMTRRTADGEVDRLGEVIAGIVVKHRTANSKTTIEALQNKLPLVQQALPAGITLEVFYDQADLVNRAVSTVSQALLLALLLIVLLQWLLLRHLYAMLLVVLTVPVALLLALLVMEQLGMTANLMSLGGLALAIGILVDGAVVIVDALLRRLAQGCVQQQSISIRDEMQQVLHQMAKPVLLASLVVMLAFAPLFVLPGVGGQLFQPMAVSILLALAAALLCALLLVPALAVLLLQPSKPYRPVRLIRLLELGYHRLLRRLLPLAYWLLGMVLVLGLAGVLLLSRLGTEFVPELEEGTLNLRVTLAPTASLETALYVAPQLEAMLLEFPEVRYALSKIGAAELGGDPEPVSNIEIIIGLTPVNRWQSADNRQQLQQQMHEKLSAFPGLLLNFSQPIATRVDELLAGVQGQLVVRLAGPELAVLAEHGEQIADLLQQIPGAVDVATEVTQQELQLLIEPKREQLARYGVTVADIMQLITQGVAGVSAGTIVDGNARYAVAVRLAEPYRQHADALAALPVRRANGQSIRLGELVQIQLLPAPSVIRRDAGQRRLMVQANVRGRDIGSVVQQLEQGLSRLQLPAGYSVQIGGQYQLQQQAMQRLQWLIPLSLLAMALLLYASVRSVRQLLLLLSAIPMALFGGVLTLWLGHWYLSVPAMIGLMMVFGLAILNGVVLLDAMNQRQQTGMSRKRAILSGASQRLRPVLMTASTTALGLLPLLLATGVGSEIQRPLAVVVLGGLCTATLLTLLVLPVLNYRFERR
ncbi:CusA/CzcA family heavy metal efflux RND transporter [Alkalimonas collagenimarina]|uniref:CusA/CzcA family heavy metal efflux RND transporter n=1 Tax=Alkalimonas collagenimarina TaxID=400390 RepID=A0ABT9GWD1_9GAMM|nr:CusA/CzcA family heavy metal efflux RND transporter [Alkalimonas collagenimarina]MDP4535365.1 CusA/CzcA family heavy metal efflux RND transporter [Alkalimonas collagenimarina]